MNAQQKLGTTIKDYMITLMGYFTEAAYNKTNLDQNTQIKMVLKSLSNHYVSFRVPYNLRNKTLTFTKLMKELQCYELMLNGSQLVRRAEANIVVASFSQRKGKRTKKSIDKVSSLPQVERKRTRKPKDLPKSKFFS
ncbi:hypothetical protein J1N35_044600 [Gossypium stocksii]|uniref:Gag/pol protein n=1 Tax=Gossypium stocksii TaxID=47602 RepID=A0A9D3U9C4_9ROSI|nr:hypothetical protein J1N35_044600 [Gossypium stocksii]